MEMLQIVQAIQDIASNSSRNYKIEALKKYASVDGLKEVLKFMYDPYITTGIADKKLIKGQHNGPLKQIESVDFGTLMDYLREHNTGSDDAVRTVWEIINGLPDECKELGKAIATKSLKIGVTANTLCKVYGSTFIPKVGVMLAQTYGQVKAPQPPYIATEKLDGNRRALVKENGKVTIYTRSGRIDDGLVDIEREAQLLPDNAVYDGELLATGVYDDCIAQRQATNSLANRKGTKTGLALHVFDVIPVDEFKADNCTYSALLRKCHLAATFGDQESLDKLTKAFELPSVNYDDYETAQALKDCNFIKAVPVLGVISTEEEILDLVVPMWENGKEGIMLNVAKGAYRIKRSNDLIKVKEVQALDLEVTGFTEGTGKYAGMVGALEVNYKGYTVGVGSGLSDEDRKDIWNNPEQYIGLIAEIEFQGESTNAQGQKSLSCPRFKGFRYDKEVPDQC